MDVAGHRMGMPALEEARHHLDGRPHLLRRARVMRRGQRVQFRGFRQPVRNQPLGQDIGIDLVAKSKPDGDTHGVAGVGPTANIPLLDPKQSYQPLRDLDMIAGLNVVDMVFVALPGLKQTSLKDVLDAARAEPDKLSYATPGVAGPAHLDFSNLAQLAGIKMIHVPFAGDSPAITAGLTGDVTIALVPVAAATPFLTSGQLQGLAAGRPHRL